MRRNSGGQPSFGNIFDHIINIRPEIVRVPSNEALTSLTEGDEDD